MNTNTTNQMPPGTLCRVTHLRSMSSMNGKLVRISGAYDEKEERYPVFVFDTKATVLIKPANLKRVPKGRHPELACSADDDHQLETCDPEQAPYRFADFDGAAFRHLCDEGFVVIRNMLSAKELAHAEDLLWNFLRSLGWKRRDARSWESPLINPKGIVWGAGAGQSPFCWFIRTRPRVVRAFAALWSAQTGTELEGAKDLLCSMDGLSVFRPWHLNGGFAAKWKTQSGWYHIDQNVKAKPGCETIQGLVTLFEQSAATGSTVVIPRSHKWCHSLVPNLTHKKGDFVRMPKEQLSRVPHRRVLLCTMPGDLVLFDSRTIHCNSPAILPTHQMRSVHEASAKAKGQRASAALLRGVAYVCMLPKTKVRDLSVIRQRIRAFETHCTANHWPNKCELHERPHGMAEQRVSDIRDPLVRSLIGVEMLKSPAFRHLPDAGDAQSRELHYMFKSKEQRANKAKGRGKGKGKGKGGRRK